MLIEHARISLSMTNHGHTCSIIHAILSIIETLGNKQVDLRLHMSRTTSEIILADSGDVEDGGGGWQEDLVSCSTN